jgi:putative MATE family efflux protein
MSQAEKVEYMLKEPVPRLVAQLAAPSIISMLISSFYNMADTFFVGRINTQATAAVGVVFSVMAMIQAIAFMCGQGSGTFISRKLGAGEYQDANIMAAVGFFGAFLLGIVVLICGEVFLHPLASLLGSSSDMMPYTVSYLRFILIGAPFTMSSMVLNNQLRFQGSAVFAMVGVVAGAGLNILLDPILIFGCNMGVAGAAVATTISQVVSFTLMLVGCSRGGNIRIRLISFKPNFFYIKEVVRGGFPSLCRQGLASVATVALNYGAGKYGSLYGSGYGDAAIAGMSIVSRISMFANSALIGFGQGFQPVCGMNYGAQKFQRVREAFRFCVKYAVIFLVIVSIFAFVFAEQLVTLFRRGDPDVIRVGTLALRFQCSVFPLNSWIIMCNMMTQSIGKAAKASLLSVARQGLFFLPFILILPHFFGLLGVQISQTCSDVCSFILSIPIGISVLKEMKKMEIPEA